MGKHVINKIVKLFNNQRAFTLVEAVVAISIIGVIGIIMSDILSRAFDNTQKTNLISNVQQNGQAALSIFEESIRYAEFVCVGGYDGPGAGANPIATNTSQREYHRPVFVVFKDGKFIRLRIVPESGGINGVITEDFPDPPVVDDTATDLCTPPGVVPNTRIITNNTMLSVKRGTILLHSNPVNSQTIGTNKVSVTVQFALGSLAGSNARPESQIGSNNEIVFQTTSQFR